MALTTVAVIYVRQKKAVLPGWRGWGSGWACSEAGVSLYDEPSLSFLPVFLRQGLRFAL